jgi:cyclic lactone autoinducer peptide
MRAILKALGLASLLVGTSAALSACGGVYYAATINGAASKLEEARVLGADTLAPYEYYYAKEHLEQAQFEAAEASYSDAANFAETASEYAEKAVQLAQAAHRAAGRP